MNADHPETGKPLRSLFIEDNEDDVLLLVENLQQGGFALQWRQVDSEQALRSALEQSWDIVFSDYSMPGFSGSEALRIVREIAPELPLVFVSGTIGETAAVNAIRNGAKDYVLKHDLGRLIPAVQRELVDCQLRSRQKNLEDMTRKMSMAVKQTADSVYIADPAGIIEYVNPALEAMLGYRAEDVIGRSSQVLLSVEHDHDVHQSIMRMVRSGGVYRGTVVNSHKNGQLVYEERVVAPLKDHSGKMTHIVSTGRDITHRILAEESRERLVSILEATPDIVLVFELNGRFRYLNSAGRALCGIDAEAGSEEVGNMDLTALFPAAMAREITGEILPQLALDGSWSGECTLNPALSGNAAIPVSLVLLAHRQKDGRPRFFSAIARDLTPQKQLEARLKHQATYDGLTGLPNRFLLLDRLKQAIPRARRRQANIAILFLDMDNFKRVNDTLGHYIGDELLKHVASRIQQHLRPNDTIARHGGDEFTILVEDLDKADHAVAVLNNLHQAFEQPVLIDRHEIFVSFSTGISMYPQDGESVEDLLRFADTAMYRAKARQGVNGRYCFYLPEMNSQGDEMLSMEADVWRSLERNEYQLFYQPQIRLRDGKLCAVEALLRWQHPARGTVSPEHILPMLENTGLIISVGEWALRTACSWLRKVNLQRPRPLRCAVNISPNQFNDHDFLNKVTRAIKEEAINPTWLEMEITEQIAMSDPQFAAEVLKELNAIGVRTAIDDFGTGYSSLAYLKKFPINVLKIDREFIADVDRDENDVAIVEASLLIAQRLSMETVAEGVETRQQLDFLKARQCDYAQGYFFSKPLPADQLEALLADRVLLPR